MGSGQKPLELILARNLMMSLSTPAFLVDGQGVIVFYNEATGALLGRRFEESGEMTAEEWGQTFGPFDENDEAIPFGELAITTALREGRPAHDRLRIRSVGGTEHDIEVSALPIVVEKIQRGAMVVFWPLGEGSS